MTLSVLHLPHLRLPLLIGLLLLTGADVHAAALHCRVVNVVSGDTLSVQCPEGRMEVRLDGVAGPRQQAIFWNRARRELSDLVLDQPVDVQVTAREEGALVGRVYLGKVHVNARLVSSGLGECQSPDGNAWCAPLEAQARADLRGLWSDPWQTASDLPPPVAVARADVPRAIARASTVPPKRKLQKL